MASYTSPILHATGDDLAVSDYNAVANNTTFLYQAPYIHCTTNSTQSITANTSTQVVNLAIDYSGYGWSLASNYIVVPLTGIYMVSAVSTYVIGGSAAQVGTAIIHNGSYGQFYWTDDAIASSDVSALVTDTVKASAGDTIGIGTFTSVTNTLASGASIISAFLVGSQ